MLGKSLAELRAAAEHDADLAGWMRQWRRFLEASEIRVIEVMRFNGLWPPDRPIPPGPRDEHGDLEFGLVAYWLNHPPGWLGAFVDHVPGLDELWQWLVADWIPTHLTPELVGALEQRVEGSGIVVDDGGIYSTHTYDKLDPGWAGAVLNDIQTEICDAVVPYPRPTTSIEPIAAEPRRTDASRVRIALVSDWGTGHYDDDPARDVMQQILRQEPDYLVHLGDVYYAGTNGAYRPPHEMTRNFLDLWPDTAQLPAGRSFALNGNHEMYAGGQGYFNVALQDERFAAQRGVGYFALRFGGWTVLGLDSAYYSNAFLYLDGSLGPPDAPQREWLAGLDLDPARTIVLTHHNGLRLAGDAETGFWNDVHRALGADPAVWYWGHVHYGVAYRAPTATGRATRARCIGHGALPYGKAPALARPCGAAPAEGAGPCHADYWVQDPDPHGPEAERMRNGFAVLDIHRDGRLVERFHERGIEAPVYTHTLGAGADPGGD